LFPGACETDGRLIGRDSPALLSRARFLPPRPDRRALRQPSGHRLAGQPFDRNYPAIGAVLAGIRRRFGSRQEAKSSILTSDLRNMARALPVTPSGFREASILLVGFTGAFRLSELAALDLEDLELAHQGAIITVRRSRTEWTGAGRKVGITRDRKGTCPVVALERWIEAGGITAGPVFGALDRGHAGQRPSHRAGRQGRGTADWLDPRRVAGHSLRSGFATSAGAAGPIWPTSCCRPGPNPLMSHGATCSKAG
jgi:integrase